MHTLLCWGLPARRLVPTSGRARRWLSADPAGKASVAHGAGRAALRSSPSSAPLATGHVVLPSRHASASEPACGAAGAAPAAPTMRRRAAGTACSTRSLPPSHSHAAAAPPLPDTCTTPDAWVPRQPGACSALGAGVLCTEPAHVPGEPGNCTIALTRLHHMRCVAHAYAWRTRHLQCGSVPCWCVWVLRSPDHTRARNGSRPNISCTVRMAVLVCMAARAVSIKPNQHTRAADHPG